MTSELAERLERCFSGAVHDLLRGLGFQSSIRNRDYSVAVRPNVVRRSMAASLAMRSIL